MVHDEIEELEKEYYHLKKLKEQHEKCQNEKNEIIENIKKVKMQLEEIQNKNKKISMT